MASVRWPCTGRALAVRWTLHSSKFRRNSLKIEKILGKCQKRFDLETSATHLTRRTIKKIHASLPICLVYESWRHLFLY